jgi:hypothetical protein
MKNPVLQTNVKKFKRFRAREVGFFQLFLNEIFDRHCENMFRKSAAFVAEKRQEVTSRLNNKDARGNLPYGN